MLNTCTSHILLTNPPEDGVGTSILAIEDDVFANPAADQSGSNLLRVPSEVHGLVLENLLKQDSPILPLHYGAASLSFRVFDSFVCKLKSISSRIRKNCLDLELA